ncbi:hypothetical protein GWK47_039871 [Chionoecetes opilio]|uniref:Uncharacterized protein n=1 Tax=Chionoecetes opilio TaxID=41210 RepID=A0A8J4YB73_CHIOP|nr:hypothetical protein GWK47_039871 [Chionoecetes opilio]
MESGRAGVGILVRQYDVHACHGPPINAYRLSDAAISSTQAELSAILLVLGKVKDGVGDTYLCTTAGELWNPSGVQHPVFEERVNGVLWGILQGIERQVDRDLHLGAIPCRDKLSMKGWMTCQARQTCRDSVDQGHTSMRHVKTRLGNIQNDTDKTRMENKYGQPRSWQHYTNLPLQTHSHDGKHKLNGKTQSSTRLEVGVPLLLGIEA